MSDGIKRVNGWWEDEFAYDIHDDEQMANLHEVLPTGYFIAVDMSAGYDAPDESDKYVMLLKDGGE